MTKFNLISFQSVVFFMVMMSCKGDDPGIRLEDLQNETRTKLIGTWNSITITKDNADVTGEFSAFTIDFSSTGFSTTNGEGIWPTSSSWDFKTGSSDVIIRNDLVEISLTFSANDTDLSMAFSLSNPGGRITSIAGEYVFLVGR